MCDLWRGVEPWKGMGNYFHMNSCFYILAGRYYEATIIVDGDEDEEEEDGDDNINDYDDDKALLQAGHLALVHLLIYFHSEGFCLTIINGKYLRTIPTILVSI